LQVAELDGACSLGEALDVADRPEMMSGVRASSLRMVNLSMMA